MCVDADGSALARSLLGQSLATSTEVMERFGLGERWSLLYDGGREIVGRAAARWSRGRGRSALLLNVMGFLDDEEILAAAPLRAFLDIDPGFGQIWERARPPRPLHGHDRYVTVGERIGEPGCSSRPAGSTGSDEAAGGALRVAGRPRPRRPLHERGELARARSGPLEYEGRTYGLRAHEFRRFFELPDRTAARFEVALDIDEAEVDDLRRLRAHGWTLADPRAGGGRSVALPRVHPALGGGADDRQEPLRRHPQRLVQRPQRLLPGERPAGTRPGHRARRARAQRRGAPDLLHARGGGGGGGGDRRGLRAAQPGGAGRSPRSTSPPSGCSRGCSRSSGCDEHRRRRRSPRQQAGPGRRGMGEAELGPRPATARLRRLVRRAARRVAAGRLSGAPPGSGRSPSGSASPDRAVLLRRGERLVGPPVEELLRGSPGRRSWSTSAAT